VYSHDGAAPGDCSLQVDKRILLVDIAGLLSGGGMAMGDRLLLRGGHVLTVDPQLGDLPKGDVLIDGETIETVAPSVDADAEVIDATGMIVIPGFVDTHRHTWEAAIRNCAPDATLADYFVEVLDSFAPLYRPDDVYASNLAGSLECINAGITTLVDWSHINNTPEHPDAAVNALQETGIRAQYAYGSANTSLADYWAESKLAIPADDVRRVRGAYFSSDDGLLTMALATRGPVYCTDDVVRAEWGLARDLGIPITIHVAMHSAGRFAMVKRLSDLGLLGPDTTYIHCCYLSDEEWRLLADSGGTVSIAPQIELQMGHGWPPVMKAIEYGLRPSLSIDVVTTAPGDMFTQMRAAFGAERARVNAAIWEVEAEVPENMLKARQMLEMATINGAHVAGLEDRTGSLTPGKQADVVLIDATALNVAPVIDANAAVVLCADVSNVDTVIIGGKVHKRDGRLLADAGRARRLVEEASEHLVHQAEQKQQQQA
jgi:cytosine/adenosine deaminase-related metal-dependent hydrolase